jgi:hypothetical protein
MTAEEVRLISENMRRKREQDAAAKAPTATRSGADREPGADLELGGDGGGD